MSDGEGETMDDGGLVDVDRSGRQGRPLLSDVVAEMLIRGFGPVWAKAGCVCLDVDTLVATRRAVCPL